MPDRPAIPSPPTIASLQGALVAVVAAVVGALLMLAGPAMAAPPTLAEAVTPLPVVSPDGAMATESASPSPTVAIRVIWGGGKPRRWSGTIRVVEETPGAEALTAVGAEGETLPWRLISTDPEAAARIHAVGQTVMVHQPAECPLDGVELGIAAWPTARVVVDLVPDGRTDQARHAEYRVSDLIEASAHDPLDDAANRLTIRRAPGDEIRVSIDGGSLRSPGETVRLEIDPLLPPRAAAGATVELRVKVRDAADGSETHTRSWLLHDAAPITGEECPSGPPQRFEPLSVDVPLPPREGAYDVTLEITERGGLRWARPLASRTIQLVAVTATAPRPRAEGDWRVLYELDPTSPRLMERLRRLPTIGRQAAQSLPHVPLPVTIPKVPLPTVSIPRIPGVGAVVPKLTGLLSAGHSMLEPHPVGALFRLPPSRSADEPSWEAIQLSGVVPGAPHRMEIDHPLADDEMVSITVLEEVGTGVVATYQGGFAVEGQAGSTGIGHHACTFWPHTRTPLVVIGNGSLRTPASFGTVRILAGPSHLPTATTLPIGQSPRRSTYGVIGLPDLDGFGGPFRVAPAGGRTHADWRTTLVAARTSAEWFAAQGAAGAMVTVYADGAAAWPSSTTAAAPRWDGTGSFDTPFDPAQKDVVELLCRTYRRQGLRLVPAIDCHGPLLAIEARLAAPIDTTGLVCVGRDGRPRRGGAHPYNILDPRVQEAIAGIVFELADRVEDREAVDGIALLLPHDGWFHLPGVAWGLDDTTFSRFTATHPEAAAAVAAAGPDAMRADDLRFAVRAALVEGPLRELWLDWRCAEIAAFVDRLAGRIAAHDSARTLSIVPTTLFTAGDLAPRFRPVLAQEPATADIGREVGLDPARLTATDSVVWVSPHVHVATDTMVERDTLRTMNRTAGAEAARARRRAALAIEQPTTIELRPVAAAVAFGNATTAAPARVHAVRTGVARERMLAEIVSAADCERVYDSALAFRQADDLDHRLARMLAALPESRLETIPDAPRPLVARAVSGPAGTAVVVTNLSPVRCRALLDTTAPTARLFDGVDTRPLSADPAGEISFDLGPWQTRVVTGVGPATLRGAGVGFDAGLAERIERDLVRLRKRRAALEMPAPIEVLDNPGFEFPDHDGGVPGWELLEPQRGRLQVVSGAPDGSGRGVAFGSEHGLATLRSNPFAPPATGRLSIALWLRIEPRAPQPVLRIALEGLQDDREYYRFAAVGHGPGARALSPQWSQFVLQVDDLPTRGMESLRVRLDLLAGGRVEVDDVRVFDLAFDESQRVQLSKVLALADHHLASGDLGACVLDLDSHWPRFLDTFVTDDAADRAALAAGLRSGRGDGEEGPGAAARGTGQTAADPKPAADRTRTGFLEAVRRFWK
jgi:hypothetical protein